LDGTLTDTSAEIDSEAALLLVNIDSALRSLGKSGSGEDPSARTVQETLSRLEGALHTYGSVKHLLPKLNLTARHRAAVEAQLRALRARILACGPHEDC
jgi:hypothetical protein